MTPNLLDELEALASAWDAKAERARDDAEYAKAGALEDCADDLREKAPALADMAKRMEAAERDAAWNGYYIAHAGLSGEVRELVELGKEDKAG